MQLEGNTVAAKREKPIYISLASHLYYLDIAHYSQNPSDRLPCDYNSINEETVKNRAARRLLYRDGRKDEKDHRFPRLEMLDTTDVHLFPALKRIKQEQDAEARSKGTKPPTIPFLENNKRNAQISFCDDFLHLADAPADVRSNKAKDKDGTNGSAEVGGGGENSVSGAAVADSGHRDDAPQDTLVRFYPNSLVVSALKNILLRLQLTSEKNKFHFLFCSGNDGSASDVLLRFRVVPAGLGVADRASNRIEVTVNKSRGADSDGMPWPSASEVHKLAVIKADSYTNELCLPSHAKWDFSFPLSHNDVLSNDDRLRLFFASTIGDVTDYKVDASTAQSRTDCCWRDLNTFIMRGILLPIFAYRSIREDADASGRGEENEEGTKSTKPTALLDFLRAKSFSLLSFLTHFYTLHTCVVMRTVLPKVREKWASLHGGDLFTTVFFITSPASADGVWRSRVVVCAARQLSGDEVSAVEIFMSGLNSKEMKWTLRTSGSNTSNGSGDVADLLSAIL